MKLLFYSPVNLQAGLGCERWHCDITESLKKQFGHDIKIVTGNLGIIRWSSDYLRTQLRGTPHQIINYPVVMSSLMPTPDVVIKLYKEIKSVDVIHFINGFIGQDMLMAFLKIITQKRIIVGHHAPIFHSSKFHNLYMKYISRYVLKIFDGHMVLNKKDFNVLVAWGIKNVNFIPSGINTSRFLNLKRTTHKTINYLLVGRYDTQQKGFDLAVNAISKFNNKYTKNLAKFYFAGSGAGRTIVEEYSEKEKNLINVGFTKYEDMPNLYKNSDIFLLSSREEPFGLILIEAWSSGIPVLATKTEGPLDMLIENNNGWFIEEISESGIFKGIERTYKIWLKNKGKFKLMSKSCIDTGKQYNISRTAKTMNKLFQI